MMALVELTMASAVCVMLMGALLYAPMRLAGMLDIES